MCEGRMSRHTTRGSPRTRTPALAIRTIVTAEWAECTTATPATWSTAVG